MAEKRLSLDANLNENVSRKLGGMARAARGAERAMSSLTRSSAVLTGAQRAAAGAIDKVGDEARESAVEMSVMDAVMKNMSVSAGALSVNVGAFTIALRNVATQIPLLITSAGTLIAILGALGTAAIGAATGVTALFAGGVLARAEEINEQLGAAAEEGEAFQAILGGIRDTFVKAMGPLMNAQNIAFFQRVINGLAGLVNRFAKATEAMRDTFIDFIDPIAESFDKNLDRIFSAFQFLMENVDPMLQDFFIFLIEKMPNALEFIARTTLRLEEPLTSFFGAFNDLVSTLINLAVRLGQTILPILEGLINVFNEIITFVNQVGGQFVAIAAGFAVLAVVTTRVVGALNSLALVGLAASSSIIEITAGAKGLTQAFRMLAGAAAQATLAQLQGFRELGAILLAVTIQGKSLNETFDQFVEAADDAEEEGEDTSESLDDVAQSAAFAQHNVDELSDELVMARNDMLQAALAAEGMDESFENIGSRQADIFAGTGGVLATLQGGGVRTPGPFESPGNMDFKPRVERVGRTGLPAVPADMSRINARGTRRGQRAGGAARTAAGLAGVGVGIEALDDVGSKFDKINRKSKNLGLTVGRLFNRFLSFSAMLGSAATSAISSVVTWLGGLITSASLSSLSIQGLATSARGATMSLWATVSGAAAAAAGFLSTAAAAAVAGVSINAALAGLPIILAAIVGLLGAFVGLLGNIDNITSGARSSFEGLKNIMQGLFDSILKIGVPAWNFMVEVMNTFIAVAMIIPNILTKIFRFFGLVGDEATFFGTVLDGIIGMLSIFVDILSFAVEQLLFMLETFNDIIGADALDGIRTTEEDVRSNVTGLTDEQNPDDITTRANPNLSVKNETNNNVEEINARPEDSERIKGLVKDAMEEANTFRRRSQGF